MRLAPLYCASLVLLAAGVHAELLQVQVLHRHGARPHLKKTSADPSVEVGGAELLPEGVAEMLALGQAVRDRYLEKGGPAVIADSSGTYSSSADFYALSSQTSRTLSSSRAFIEGVYGDSSSTESSATARVPTHVFASESRDWRLRGYTMCPAFSSAIEALLQSDDFRKKESQVSGAGDLREAGEAIGEKNPDLAHAFNIFDRLVLARGNYAAVDAEAKAYQLSDAAFEEIKSAADWIESRKYGDSATAGTLVSGGLLNDMLRRADAMLQVDQADVGYEKTRLVEYSGHYPLLLGAFSALDIDSATFTAAQSAPAKDASTTIPAFASALVWEVHSGGNVKMFWVAGGQNATFVPIPCSSTKTDVSCPLAAISSQLSDAVSSRASFCSKCGYNEKVNSDVCSSSASVGGSSNGFIGFGGFISGILVGALAACLYITCAGRRRSRQQIQNAPIQPLENNDFNGGSSEEIGVGEIGQFPPSSK